MQSMEFSRPEYWSGELFPSPGGLPNSGIELRSLTLQVDSLPAEKQGKPQILEWVAYPFSRGPSQPRNQTGVSWVAGGYPYCGILFSLIKEWDSDSCYNMSEICSVLSDSLQPHGLYSPWNSPGQNTGVGSLFLLQGIFPTQGSNPGLPHGRQILYQMNHSKAQERWSG